MGIQTEKERMEARIAGEKALNSLLQAQERLRSARNWGIYDMLGGKFLSSLIKQKRIRETQMYISQAREDLRAFGRELRDLKDLDMQLETRDLLGFADLFFDGFLADVLMQKRIQDALTDLNRATEKVRSILRRLS